MRLDYKASSLVIIGGWNPNILNEDWIRKNLLDHPNEQVNIGVRGNFFPTGIPVSVPEAMFRNVRLAVLGERLELNLIDGNDFVYIEDCARKLCDRLPNTLVTSYGVNFSYVADMINSSFTNIFRADVLSQMARVVSHAYNINFDGIITNVNIDINNEENKSGIRFNFHFNIDDLSKLIPNINQYPMELLKRQSIEFIQSNYGIRIGG